MSGVEGVSGANNMMGFNSPIDTQALVDLELEQLLKRSEPYEERVEELGEERNNWGAVRENLLESQGLIEGIKNYEDSDKDVMMPDESGFDVTAGSESMSGSYEIDVEQVAQSHKVSSVSFEDPHDSLGINGEFNFQGEEIVINEDMSLYDVAMEVNRGENDVKSTIVGGQLILESEKEGEENAISIDGNEEFLQELGFTDEEGNFRNQFQEPQDAIVNVAGEQYTYSTNQVTDLIDDVEIELYSESEGPIQFEIGRDDEKFLDEVEEMFERYNEMVQDLNGLTDKDAPFQGDNEINQIRRQLISVFNQDFGGEFAFEYGIERGGTALNGTVEFDREAFEEKLSEDRETTMETFLGENGIAETIENELDRVTRVDGMIDMKKDSIDRGIENSQRSIDRNESMFDRQRENIIRKYARMDVMMSDMDSQMQDMQGMLSGLNPGGG